MAQFVWPPTSIDTTGLATSANQVIMIGELQDIEAELNTLNAVDFATETTLTSIDSKVLTDTQLRATPVPVSGPLTDTELRATAVPVSGPLTDTELRATAVPVSAASLPLPTGAATEATLANLDARLAGSLVPEAFDYQDITYVLAGNGQGEISTVVFKSGGSGGTTVATLTMTYDANDKLSTVTRS